MSERVPAAGNGRKARAPRPKDYYCRTCGRLLFRAYLAPGSRVEIRCRHNHCGRTTIYETDSLTGSINFATLPVTEDCSEQAASSAVERQIRASRTPDPEEVPTGVFSFPGA